MYLNDCPIRQDIPINLIGFGVLSITNGLIQVIRSKCIDRKDRRDGFASLAVITLCLNSQLSTNIYIGELVAFINGISIYI